MADAIGSESAAVVHPTRPPSFGSGIPSPRSSAATPAWVGGNKTGGNATRRSYEQIISDSSSNILIRITIRGPTEDIISYFTLMSSEIHYYDIIEKMGSWTLMSSGV